MTNLGIAIGDKMTLGELDIQINGDIENCDIKREIIIKEEKRGFFDFEGCNYGFRFDKINVENILNTIIIITDIEKL
ncbi:MAG: hypothetical protein PF487_05490 [Bacteroidales bacterium]|jgi:hypothetical protein|nr:hypothetical protein [Bacteroidales bacterium]